MSFAPQHRSSYAQYKDFRTERGKVVDTGGVDQPMGGSASLAVAPAEVVVAVAARVEHQRHQPAADQQREQCAAGDGDIAIERDGVAAEPLQAAPANQTDAPSKANKARMIRVRMGPI